MKCSICGVASALRKETRSKLGIHEHRVPTEADDGQLTAALEPRGPESSPPLPTFPIEPWSSTTRMDRTETRNATASAQGDQQRKDTDLQKKELTLPKRVSCRALLVKTRVRSGHILYTRDALDGEESVEKRTCIPRPEARMLIPNLRRFV